VFNTHKYGFSYQSRFQTDDSCSVLQCYLCKQIVAWYGVLDGYMSKNIHVYPLSGIGNAILFSVLVGEFLWIPCLWLYLAAINYLRVHLNLDASGWPVCGSPLLSL
jgi:hypothetical protein